MHNDTTIKKKEEMHITKTTRERNKILVDCTYIRLYSTNEKKERDTK